MIKLNKKGFTLVELLAVIVILALLMVVATRTIGTSLTNSKKEAMKSEAIKIVSKAYEDIQMNVVNGTGLEWTYKNNGANPVIDNTTKNITFTDGDYKIKLTLDSATAPTKIDAVCISQGTTSTKYGKTTKINGGTADFSATGAYIYTDTAC